jgi:hypothetical protein
MKISIQKSIARGFKPLTLPKVLENGISTVGIWETNSTVVEKSHYRPTVIDTTKLHVERL